MISKKKLPEGSRVKNGKKPKAKSPADKKPKAKSPAETAIEAAIALHGHTVTGVERAVADASVPLIAQHLKLVAAEKPGKNKSQPGHPDYDPVAAAARLATAILFPSTSRNSGKTVQVQPGEEFRLMRVLSTLALDATPDDLNRFLESNTNWLISASSQGASHASRLANTSTSVCFTNTDEADESSPYLSSVTVTSPIRAGHFGSAGESPVARVLFSSFLYGAQPSATSLYRMACAGDSDSLRAFGFPEKLARALVTAAAESTPTIAERVVQVIWPSVEGNVCLSPLPSIAVLDEISRLHQYEVLREAMPGRRVALETLEIGGSNARNVGAFNGATGGKYPIWRTSLYTAYKSATQRAERRLYSTHWLGFVRKDTAERLLADISAFNSLSKNAYLKSLAKAVIGQGLSFAKDVRGMLEADPALKEKLAERQKNNPVWHLLMTPQDKECVEAVVDGLVHLCVQAGAKKLATDADKLPRFKAALTAEILDGAW